VGQCSGMSLNGAAPRRQVSVLVGGEHLRLVADVVGSAAAARPGESLADLAFDSPFVR
jgi:hypothetical protein